jgi:hypothetical protein
MTTFRKSLLASTAGLGFLALAVAPALAGSADGAEATGQVQLAHMTHGYGGQGYGYGGQGYGYGMMGPGYGMMGRGYGMMGPGYGMMGPGYGMMGPGYGYGPGPEGPRNDLSADDVRDRLERNLAWQGNKHLKVGDVKEVDKDTIVADIVTQDNSLVQRLEIDRHTGWTRSVE